MGAAAIRIVIMHFYVVDVFLIEVGEDQLNNKEMATVFRNPRWRRPPS